MAKLAWGMDFDGIFASYFPSLLSALLPTFVYLDSLMVGALCACIVTSGSPLILRLFANRALSCWLPLTLIFVLSTIKIGPYDWPQYFQTSAASYLTGILILHQWAHPFKGDYEPMATLGRISFSIYLLHAVVVDYFPNHAFPHALQFFAWSSVMIGVSMLTYRSIEQPFIRVSRALAPFGTSAAPLRS